MNWVKGAFVTGVELHRWEFLGALFLAPACIGFGTGFVDSIYGTSLTAIAILVSLYTSVLSNYNRCKTVGVHGGWAAVSIVPVAALVLAVILLLKDEKKETT